MTFRFACLSTFALLLSPLAWPGDVPEDCLGFKRAEVTIEYLNGNFTLVDRLQRMFGFGDSEEQAKRALEVIQFYKMDSTCYAGRPQAPMFYLLASGKPPTGAMPGEQCKAFDASQVTLSQTKQFWKLLAGPEVLFDFGNKELGAKQAIFAIYKYGFTHRCIVGPTGEYFRYLRR